MRSRSLLWCVLAVVLAGAGCKKKAPSAEGGSGSAAVVKVAVPVDAAVVVAAAPPVDAAPPACLPSDPAAVLEAFSADDRAATVCVSATRCIAIDLGTGVAHDVAHPPAPAPAATAGYAVKDDATGAQLCKGAACVKLALGPTAASDAGVHAAVDSHHVFVSASGLYAIALLVDDQVIGVFDTTSGRKAQAIAHTNQGACLEGARFLDDVIYVTHTNCNGPVATAELYGTDGKLIGTLDGLNVEGGTPVRLSADTWVVPGLGGAGALVFEPKTGRILRKPMGGPDKFTQCAGCTPLGTGEHFAASPLVVTASGKLVEVGDSGGVWVIDPNNGQTVRAWPILTCPPAAATP